MPLRILLCLFAVCGLQRPAIAATQVIGKEQLRTALGVARYAAGDQLANVKVAILDNGFGDFLPKSGMLPDSAERIDGPVDPLSPTDHGLGMAQIVWALTGQNPQGPKFYLVNSNGFSNLKAAIDFVIAKHVDIVLYSQTWPFGTNFDGTGFINDNVNRAVQAGIIWINAAGNDHNLVFNSPIVPPANSAAPFLQFNGRDYLRFSNKLDQNQVRITLSWNDFRDEHYNTDKSLFLYVYDSTEKLIASSTLIQQGQAPPPTGASNLSSYARQSVGLLNLDRGEYRIRIKDHSQNFTKNDQLRVLIGLDNSGSVDFTDHTSDGEIMAPADNPNVLTVGEGSDISSLGPTSDKRAKPDVIVRDATVSFTNGEEARGSSNAAAMVAGSVATLKANQSSYTFQDLWSRVAQLKAQVATPADLSPNLGVVPAAVQSLVPIGASLMRKSTPRYRFVVLCKSDPLNFPMFSGAKIQKQHADDILTIDPMSRRWTLFYKAQDAQINSLLVEFRQALPLATAPIFTVP